MEDTRTYKKTHVSSSCLVSSDFLLTMRDAADDVGEEAVKRAVAQSASQNPYSPYAGAGSLRTTVPETCSPVRRCTPSIGMERLQRRRSEERGKTLGAGGSWVEVTISHTCS